MGRNLYRGHIVELVKELDVVGSITGAEVGVWRGDTSACLLSGVPGLKLYMIDPWEVGLGKDPTVSLRRRESSIVELAHENALKVTEFAEDRRTVVVDFSVNAAKQFQDESLDFVFVDANHQYENVKEDLEAWYPKVRTGGLIVGHDYGIKEYLGWGVKRAADEFALSKDRVITDKLSCFWFYK